MTSNNTASTMMKTSLVAGMLGAGIALMLAPRSGKETRQRIHDKASHLQNKATETFGSASQSLQDEIDKASNQLAHMQEEMRIKRQDKRQSPILTDWEREN